MPIPQTLTPFPRQAGPYGPDGFGELADIDFSGLNNNITNFNQQYVIQFGASPCKPFSLVPTQANVRLTLTSAQVLALNSVPVEAIPMPGANQYIVIDNVLAALDFNTTAYTLLGSDLELRYFGGVLAANPYLTFLDQNANVVQKVYGSENVQLPVNQAVYIGTSVADPTLGDSPIIVDITYRIVEFII